MTQVFSEDKTRDLLLLIKIAVNEAMQPFVDRLEARFDGLEARKVKSIW